MFSSASRKPVVLPQRDETKNQQNDSATVMCFKCNTRGHKAVNCPSQVKKCFVCGTQGHEAETAAQVHRSQEDKIKMVSLCNVGK